MPRFSDSLREMHSEEWNRATWYDGLLGAVYSKEQTRFFLWAPTAVQVDLHLLRPKEILLPMSPLPEQPAVWGIELKGDCDLYCYQYRLIFASGTVNHACDPYACAVTANGEFSVVVDAEAIAPEGWDAKRLPGIVDRASSIIYEAHIRDLTIAPDNGIRHKGKFLGLCEENTFTDQGNPSGLNYIKSLGITHLQLLPVFDFASVDERADLSYNAQYNWGYDPLHYNVPEGSYASDPEDPKCRILELKALIQTLHRHGIRVIMDVVYNHVYELGRSSLEQCVPGYYFRFDENGRPMNGTGVGNETASEQWMFRRYMIDSLLYWARCYNIDGFRFDLMGIHDVETMRQIRERLDQIDPNILLLGEGWTMGAHERGVLPADQTHAHLLPGISFFNDDGRDALRGSDFHPDEAGFASGLYSEELSRRVWNNILGKPAFRPYLLAAQAVNYCECHDNRTLMDKIRLCLPRAEAGEWVRRQELALSLLALSNGILFIHAGQEIMRSKRGYANSYNAPDEINVFPYDNAKIYEKELAFFRALLQFRLRMPALRLRDYRTILEHFTLLRADAGFIHYTLHDGSQLWHVLVNAGADTLKAETTGAGPWFVLMENGSFRACETDEAPVVYPYSVTMYRGL